MKKQTILTRKRKALRRMARTLAAVLVVNWIMGIGLLSPRHAVWQMQEREGIPGFMRTVFRDHVPEIGMTHLRYLMQNEKAVMLAGTYLTVYGWVDAFSTALDCTTGEPLHAAMDSLHRDGNDVYYLYGRIDDPEIECVEISLCHPVYEKEETAYEEVLRLSAPRKDWIEQDGRQFFVLRHTLQEQFVAEDCSHAFAIALDAAGEELFRFQISEGASSYFG